MNILSIGNSFSQDAHRYLHRIAKADGYEMNTFNLYIGGCPLSKHYRNMLSGEKAYELEMNGESTGFFVSLKDALLNRNWDVVTIQQASTESPYYKNYQPYLQKLVDYIRECVPHTKIAFHQTWAYQEDSKLLNIRLGYKHHEDMFAGIKQSWQKAVEETGADILIPSGETFEEMLKNGIEKIHRDTYHASYKLGRYTLGLLWYRVLTGNDITNNTFSDFDEVTDLFYDFSENVTDREIKIAKESILKTCEMYGV